MSTSKKKSDYEKATEYLIADVTDFFGAQHDDWNYLAINHAV